MRIRDLPARLFLLGLAVTAAAAAVADDRQHHAATPPFDAALRAAAGMPRLHSLLISHNGELVVEQYFNGVDRWQRANVKSVSKSVLSALVGIAIEQGHIESVDQPIAGYYGDLLAEPKRAITIGNLLSMQAGLETTSFYNYGAWVLSRDWTRFALEQPLQSTPGTDMHYSTGNTHLLSDILTKATGQTTYEFARRNLAEPLGFTLAEWPRDPQGIYFGGNDMELTPRQMLAFGELYMNRGKYRGRQVVPAAWVDASLTPRVTSSRDPDRQYGLGWWVKDMAGLETAYAWGYGGQFVLLVPDLDLVVVTTSDSRPDRGRRPHTRDLYDLLEYDIVAPALSAYGGNGSATAAPAAQ